MCKPQSPHDLGDPWRVQAGLIARMGYKLIYFPVRGRGESIRLLLEDNGIAYEEQVVTGQTWPSMKANMAFGQLPALMADGVELVQSNAILRFLARKHSLYGSNDKEAYMIDMINDGQEDLRMKYVRMIYTDYDGMKPGHLEILPKQFEMFEKLLKSNNDGAGFFVGDKVSFADYNMFDLLDVHLVLAPGCLDAYPVLKAFHARMLARPGIAKYRESEGFKTRNINGNGKQ